MQSFINDIPQKHKVPAETLARWHFICINLRDWKTEPKFHKKVAKKFKISESTARYDIRLVQLMGRILVDGDKYLILKDPKRDATLARAKNLLHGAPPPERTPPPKPEEHDDIAHYRRELDGFFDELIETRKRLTTLVDPAQYEARMQRIKSENVALTKQLDELQKELASAREEIAQLYVELEAGEVSVKGVSSMIPTHSKAYDKPVKFTNSALAKLNKMPEADVSVVVSAITTLAEKGYSATMSSQQHKKQVASKPLPPSVNRSRASAEWRSLWSQEADGLHVYDIGRKGDRIGGRNEKEF